MVEEDVLGRCWINYALKDKRMLCNYSLMGMSKVHSQTTIHLCFSAERHTFPNLFNILYISQSISQNIIKYNIN